MKRKKRKEKEKKMEKEKKEKSERGLGSQESSDKCISISADWRGLDGGKIEANGKKRRR